MSKSNRNVSEAKKKLIAGSQFYKCANKPDSNLKRLKDYNCPLWEKKKNKGCFDASGYEIDHIKEHSISKDDSVENLQALCLSCHKVKTKKFNMKKKKKDIKLDKNDSIEILDFGQETLDHISSKKKLKILKLGGSKGMIKLLDAIYFNKKAPYNQNVRKDKNKKINIKVDGEWHKYRNSSDMLTFNCFLHYHKLYKEFANILEKKSIRKFWKLHAEVRYNNKLCKYKKNGYYIVFDNKIEKFLLAIKTGKGMMVRTDN